MSIQKVRELKHVIKSVSDRNVLREKESEK